MFYFISSPLWILSSTYTSCMEKAMAPHSSTLAWKIPWTGEPGGLQSMGLQRVRHDWVTSFTFHFPALEKEMATHSSVLAWRIPGMAEPGRLPSLGSHRVGHDWRDLAAAACLMQSVFLWCNCALNSKKHILVKWNKNSLIIRFIPTACGHSWFGSTSSVCSFLI